MTPEEIHLDRIDRLRIYRETSPEPITEPAHPWVRYEVRPKPIYEAVCLCNRTVSSETSELRCRCGRAFQVQWIRIEEGAM